MRQSYDSLICSGLPILFFIIQLFSLFKMHSFKFPIYLTLIFPLLLAACNTMSTSSDAYVDAEKAETDATATEDATAAGNSEEDVSTASTQATQDSEIKVTKTDVNMDGDMLYNLLAAEFAGKAARQALLNLEAVDAPAGSMNVVLGPGWPGVLLHEAVGHGLEGDFNRKGSSAYAGRIGEQVASPLINAYDDGTIPGRRGSLRFDDDDLKTILTTTGAPTP